MGAFLLSVLQTAVSDLPASQGWQQCCEGTGIFFWCTRMPAMPGTVTTMQTYHLYSEQWWIDTKTSLCTEKHISAVINHAI